MPPLTHLLGHCRADHVFLAGCLSVVGLSAAGLWLLSRPSSWLSKRIDRAVTLPAEDRTLR